MSAPWTFNKCTHTSDTISSNVLRYFWWWLSKFDDAMLSPAWYLIPRFCWLFVWISDRRRLLTRWRLSLRRNSCLCVEANVACFAAAKSPTEHHLYICFVPLLHLTAEAFIAKAECTFALINCRDLLFLISSSVSFSCWSSKPIHFFCCIVFCVLKFSRTHFYPMFNK